MSVLSGEPQIVMIADFYSHLKIKYIPLKPNEEIYSADNLGIPIIIYSSVYVRNLDHCRLFMEQVFDYINAQDKHGNFTLHVSRITFALREYIKNPYIDPIKVRGSFFAAKLPF